MTTKPTLHEVADVKTYPVTIAGRVIEFTPPVAHKAFAALILGPRDRFGSGVEAIRADFDWFGAGISKQDDAWLRAALLDPTNPLEVETALRAIRGVFLEITGSPTKPSQP